MEKHGVDWPHLTGPTEDVVDVWDTFAIYTEEYVIDAHDDNVSDMEGQGSRFKHRLCPSRWNC